MNYKEQFKNKIIYCNCDSPYESNFFKYFVMNFNELRIKKLIATNYKTINFPIPYKAEVVEVQENEDVFKNPKNKITQLSGDGDFRSDECIELLKESDVIVTNPPFSLFRKYVAQLMEHDKKFLIIGNVNALTYKEFFPLIKDNKIWTGYKFNGKHMLFYVPDDYELRGRVKGIDPITGRKFIGVGGTCWYTNLDIKKRHKNITLYKKYNPEEFPKYDNYDAINVDKTSDIPYDYEGAMGVPITFVDKYNPKQFEILDAIGRYSMITGPTIETQGKYLTNVNGKPKYARIIIRRIGEAQKIT